MPRRCSDLTSRVAPSGRRGRRSYAQTSAGRSSSPRDTGRCIGAARREHKLDAVAGRRVIDAAQQVEQAIVRRKAEDLADSLKLVRRGLPRVGIGGGKELQTVGVGLLLDAPLDECADRRYSDPEQR